MPGPHPFVARPHWTLFSLSWPVLGSLIAEPLTGLIDTAFVARLGVEPLAALGVGTMMLSALFWVFSFLGVATQTRVAHLSGQDTQPGGAARLALVAVALAVAIGTGATVVGSLLSPSLARLMGAEGQVADYADIYLRVRLLGAPGMLASFAAFGALRGAQDMRTPLWIAGGINALNILLDPPAHLRLGRDACLGSGRSSSCEHSQPVGRSCVGRRGGLPAPRAS